MTADQGQAVDSGRGMDGQAEPFCFDCQARCGALVIEELMFGNGAIRFLSDRFNVETKEQVTHGGVSGHGQFVDGHGIDR